MRKQPVKWKPVRSKSVYGNEYQNKEFPALIARAYRGTLIEEILSMPAKKSISFESAVNLACDEFHKAIDHGRIGRDSGHSHWYYKNFIQWISEQGFHIELTGDEFEAFVMSDKVA